MNSTVVKRIARCNVEVLVFAHAQGDGSWHHEVKVLSLDPDGRSPLLIGVFDEQDFGIVMDLLVEADRFVNAERHNFPQLAYTED